MSASSLAVYEDSTAQAVLAWWASAYTFARRRVEYLAPEATHGWLERGQVVTITDAALAWRRQVALIEGIRTDGSPMLRLRLLLVEDPARDRRTA